MKWTPDKITALVLICGCFGLLFFGIDGEVKSILAVAAGWLFGGAFMERMKEGSIQKRKKEEQK